MKRERNLYSITKTTDDPFILLAAAVIRQVANDYILAIRKDDVREQEDCERWFDSYYFRVYSMGLNPDTIIRQCREIAKGREQYE